MSQTPETDAFIEALNNDWDYEFAALTSHAKNMERERDEARESLRQARDRCWKLGRERDEARAEAARLRSMSHVEMMSENLNVYDHTVEWENRCLKAERERDEARADADEWQNKYAEVFVERDRLREALKRIADCDWVITLPDRMDGVRKIARDALEAAK